MSHYTTFASGKPDAGKSLDEYRKRRKKFYRVLALLSLLLFLLAATVLLFGSYEVTAASILSILTGSGSGTSSVVILSLRLPRIITAIIAGWGLAFSGAVMQAVLRNPLGSPFTLGISNGAAFGAAFAIVVLGAGAGSPSSASISSSLLSLGDIYLVSLAAFISAMGTMVVVLFLAGFQKLRSDAIILAGIALSSLFTSGTILLQYLATDVELAAVVFWSFGDVSRTVWNEVALIAAVTAAASVLFMVNRWNMNAMSESDDVARSLGINTGKTRYILMIAASLITSLIVAFNGVIAFLGLLAPHLARRIVGNDMRLLLPLSGITGSLLLLAADSVGRLIIPSGSLPVGVITSFMGAPLFIMLLLRRKR